MAAKLAVVYDVEEVCSSSHVPPGEPYERFESHVLICLHI
jgi:hypothetical protein